MDYNPDYDQFAPKLNKPKAAYHTINRRDFYKTTLEEIREAFIDFFGLNNALAEQVAVLYKSDEIDELLYCKRALAKSSKLNFSENY